MPRGDPQIRVTPATRDRLREVLADTPRGLARTLGELLELVSHAPRPEIVRIVRRAAARRAAGKEAS